MLSTVLCFVCSHSQCERRYKQNASYHETTDTCLFTGAASCRLLFPSAAAPRRPSRKRTHARLKRNGKQRRIFLCRGYSTCNNTSPYMRDGYGRELTARLFPFSPLSQLNKTEITYLDGTNKENLHITSAPTAKPHPQTVPAGLHARTQAA